MRSPRRHEPGRRVERLRPGPGLATWLAILGAACASPTPPPSPPTQPGAQPVDERPVDRLLELVDVESIISARPNRFAVQVGMLAGDLSDSELERIVPIVYREFAPELLRADIATALDDGAPPGSIEQVVQWLESGANAEARRIIDAYDPPLSLRDWLGTYTSEPPPIERIRVVAQWVEAQGTATLFLLLEQALEEAAYTVLAELRPGSRGFTPLARDELSGRLERGTAAAVMRGLHESETVPTSVIEAAAREYRSEAGQWFAEAYQLAVAQAMRAAASRVVGSLRS